MFALLESIGKTAASSLRALVADAPAGAIPEALAVVPAGRPEFGDYQVSQCLALGKALKRPPRALAEAVKAALEADAALQQAIAKIEIAGPGFVNIHLQDAWLAGRVAARLGDPRLGLRSVGKGVRVVVDFSSPNVAKPMHIGHIRSTIIGDAIARTLRALDHEVITDNHLGDWGTQFGKLIVGYRKWVNEEAYAADPVGELLKLYVKFQQEDDAEKRAIVAMSGIDVGAGQLPNEDDDEAPHDAKWVVAGLPTKLMEEARAELVKLQAGEPENVALWKKFIADSRHVFEQVYARLDVRFDHWLGESAYNDQLPGVVADLVARGIAHESQGAIVVTFDESDKLGSDPFIVKKSDGAFNYASTDIATMLHRVNVFHADRILIVTDERQQLHFRQLFAVARKMGITVGLEHVWFGLMRMAEGTIKTREGNVIHLTELLDEAERRARVVALEHNPELAADVKELNEIARVVGIGCLKYNDLSKDRQTLVTFTWDKAVSLVGNTAAYLQYAYARIRSILRKGEVEAVASAAVVLGSPVERGLGKQLLAYPEVVEQVCRTARPHLVCDYLFALAGAYSTFYADHPVLHAETPALRASRLVLTELVARTLRHGLSLLGIEVVERM